jgi:DNA processing protein
LADIDDAPVMLWMIGVASVLQRPMVALVRARNASSLGTRMARKLAQELGEAGFTVVSGLARGVAALMPPPMTGHFLLARSRSLQEGSM